VQRPAYGSAEQNSLRGKEGVNSAVIQKNTDN
jgi:hypothetical protein